MKTTNNAKPSASTASCLASDKARDDLWRSECAARARALGLGQLTMADCARLDALYGDLNASGLEWFRDGYVGTLPDGRVAYIGSTFGMAGR